MEKGGLAASSEPWKFADFFLPFSNQSFQADEKNYFSFENVLMWSNQKAQLASMRDWMSFDAREIRQHFGLYVLHGLPATPKVECKFKP